MEFKEIKTGQFFTIDETPTYPKLKTEYGYIDFRDEIKKEITELDFGVRVMDDSEVIDNIKRFGIDTQEKLETVKKELLEK